MTKVFRVKHDRKFAVMSNYHLISDRQLSLKAKGMISLMLSLPDTWEYSIKGLATLCHDGVDSIRSTLKEIEQAGYLRKTQVRNAKGQFTGYDYVIYEQPRQDEAAFFAQPETENPKKENPISENPIQSNIEKHNTKQENTDVIIKQTENVADTKAVIKDCIDYPTLCKKYDRGFLDTVVDIIADCRNADSKTICGKRIYAAELHRKFAAITQHDVHNAAQAIRGRTVRNQRAYLQSVLYNGISPQINTEKDNSPVMEEILRKYRAL